MVKADVKRDYYADLDLPPTADAEDIKRQFRLLAKQFHPDRNPGREVEVLPKFQAVQAAHEILSDPVEKAKYDAARAKLTGRNTASNYTSDPYGFARSASYRTSTATPQFPFPPPPKTKDKRPQFPSPTPKSQTSSGAEKFNAFTRGAPQSWDRARFDDARAEAARVFPNMRPSPTAPPVPPRTPRQAPTAPKPSSSSDIPHASNMPPPGFPGLSRTQSARRQGYTAGSHGGDEAPAPRSAYSYVRGDRTAGTGSHGYVPDDHMRSPPVSRVRPAVSPLRHTKSSDYEMRSDSFGGSRPSSKYAGVSGERTDIHGDGLHRSASVRNSPVDPRWDDRGPFGRSSARFDHPPRHRSESPGMKPNGIHADFSSDTSSSEDEALNMNARPKAVPRPRTKPGLNPFGRTVDPNPGLTGQFPNTNYTRIVDENQYKYPPPDSREPAQKPFSAPEAAKSNGTPTFGGNSGNQDGPNHDNGPSNVQSKFSADEWHDKVTVEDFLRPTDPQMRKPSPSKTSRAGSKSTATRARGLSRGPDAESSSSSDSVSGGFTPQRGSGSDGDHHDKSTAFQQGKLPKDWAAKAKTAATEPPPTGAAQRARNSPANGARNRNVFVEDEEDVMDLDDTPAGSGKQEANHVGHQPNTEALRPSSEKWSINEGVDLKAFTQQAPFAPASTGLKDMGDIATHLPFESRPAASVDAGGKAAARLRALNLPKPPKPVVPPAVDRLDQANWLQYVENMKVYMREWNRFNAKMIEHFRIRQGRIGETMAPNWISMRGDGPDADSVDGLTGDAAKNSHEAGYAAYMQWLKDDAQCRAWWDHAHDEHMKCLEDLGRVREAAKRNLRPV
ncbi:hypothetical protein HRR83_003960 [Exophiala dermatitidis]|uniref:J domain-containing protein n=1 Tax=Exophiala dermatitidis TaxID=5970 RepID=A0AAN6IX13_EXODE|nr:hypothetical protein HRR74_002655 [Exophiala dermatitidis]KAJ4529401.1 hypothetical protein HRR73_000424 [Exophiala dermatitidis]KAJ4549118.1 hypothetical protein HRR77_003996 [Exophiala dermatitidis]KAJ4582777.1 hypothetical protein HRR81_001507 [Exophiala dermatitidis]KAJ4587521.1 hypothetical protein HRR82_001328 [Exophiala dermatitidis]